jgi:hypothetical protein
MKHEHETNIGMTFFSTKQKMIKLVEKLLIMVEQRKVTFLGCIHNSIWVLDTQDETWAKKIGFTSLKKFD